MNILIVDGNGQDADLIQRVLENASGTSRVLITKDFDSSVELLKKNEDLDIILISQENDPHEKVKLWNELSHKGLGIHAKLVKSMGDINPSLIDLFMNKPEETDGSALKTEALNSGQLKDPNPVSYPDSQDAPLLEKIPKQRFMIRSPNKLKSVTTNEVAYFYADKKLNFIRTWDNTRFIVDHTIEELSRVLDPHEFFRINRSFIISYKSIREIHVHFGNRLKLNLHPAVDDDVFVSRDKVYAFRRWIGEGS